MSAISPPESNEEQESNNKNSGDSETITVTPNISTQIRQEGTLESPTDKLELTTSPVPVTPKEKSYQDLNAISSRQNSASTSGQTAEALPVTDEQEKTLLENKKAEFPYFQIGVSEDKNGRYRRTMEDAHSYFYDFGEIEGQGFFAIFDGHAGKQAAEWCGKHFHETFQEVLHQNKTLPVPEVFNLAFLEADKELNKNAGKHSGCTAITAFLRTEESEDGEEANGRVSNIQNGSVNLKKKSKRVLYAANVGDARAVLCRNGVAIRLSYDHKGSDLQEAKRIVDAGGFVMNNRVNGVLAVTRSLGDSSMKAFVVGSPYTTQTILTERDLFLILACDGLWDVCDDQDAVDLIKDIPDPHLASRKLLEYALDNFSTDNLSVMVVKLNYG